MACLAGAPPARFAAKMKRVQAHQRMLDRRCGRALRFGHAAVAGLETRHVEVVQHAQRAESLALGGAERLVGADHVGEQSVAAMRRHLLGVEQRRERRDPVERAVAVPEQRAEVGMHGVGLAVGSDVGEFEDLRVLGLVILVEHMDFEFAEVAREGDMRGGRQRLVADEQEAVAVKRIPERARDRRRKRHGDIDASRLDAEVAVQRKQFERHVAAIP